MTSESGVERVERNDIVVDPSASVSPPRVLVFDTTLRDGEQSPGATLTAEEKLVVADALAELGVDIMEAGFPAASPGDFEAVRAIAGRVKGVSVAGLARCNEHDIERAAMAVKGAEAPRIHTFIATSDIHLEYKLRMSREQVIERVDHMVKFAKGFTSDVEFSAEDATRTDWAYLSQVIATAIAAGATTVNIPDTVGYTTPGEYAALMEHLLTTVPNIDQAIISVHCHDDLGMATSNTLAAVHAGARQVEVTMNGIGERAGNTSLEEVVMALATRSDQFRGATRIRKDRLVPTSRLVSSLTGVPVQPNKAIVGANAFAHEAGIHQDGMLKERTTYEIMNPTDVGWEGTRLVLGKHSGRAGFRSTLSDLGIRLDDEQMNEAYQRFLELADRKKTVTAADLEALVSNQLEGAQDSLQLVRWNASLGSAGPATGSVVVSWDGTERTGDGQGNGAVDALFEAIDAAVGITCELEEYNVEAVTPGEDAQGQVRLRVRVGDQVYTGHGLATDVIEASARAYLAAMSKVLQDKPTAIIPGPVSAVSRWS
jgi:2-isopropylmalate synthase